MALPVEINPLNLNVTGGYSISRSLRLRSSASAYLTRTPSVAGNQKTWTWSGWVKRGNLASEQCIFGAGTNSSNKFELRFEPGNTIRITSSTGASVVGDLSSVAVFRDPSAWYHVVLAFNVASSSIALYVNGVQQSLTTSTAFANANSYVNATNPTFLGGYPSTSAYPDHYLAEVNFIDGQALTPSSFGSTDVNGIWQPKKYTGTYGTNGFYLNFSDNSAATAAAIGKDSSGNGNNWTPNNISVTAGATYDSMLDSPTNAAGTSYGIGNYCILNPVDTSSVITLSDANLKHTGGGSFTSTRASIGMSSGKWYWEVIVISGGNYSIGIGTASVPLSANFSNNANGYSYLDNGNKHNNGTVTAYAGTMAANDVIGVTFDADAGTLAYYKNNVSLGTAFSSLTNGPFFPMLSGQGSVMIANFGQRPFTYTPPTGFKALNTYNLPTPTVLAGNKQFDATLYTGNGSSQSVVNSGSFQPDFVWQKCRSAASNNFLADSVRGINKELLTDSTASEFTSAQYITTFNSNGFSFGNDTGINTNGNTYVAWQWKGGGTGVSNTVGTISATVSANPTAGFSIVTYTGNGTAGATIGHGLGAAPKFIMIKARNAANAWNNYTTVVDGSLDYFDFSTAAKLDSTQAVPTSSVFSVSNGGNVNGSGTTYVAYCFADVAGYSKIGNYTGNGSADGPFVYLGFRPRFVLYKRSDQLGNNWNIFDTSRDTYNVSGKLVLPNATTIEQTYTLVDVLSNGFKMRNTFGDTNASGANYIYMAFAENPFNISRAR